MGGVVKITPRGSAGSANAEYITRNTAVVEQETVYHNAPEDVQQAQSWHETRIRMQTWAELTKAEERDRHGNRPGRARTHYRMILSYDDDDIQNVAAHEAREDAEEFLKEEFPNSQAVAVVHQDTDNTHVHVWMSARKLNGNKVHISKQDLENIHSTFGDIHERRTNIKSRNVEKMRETREYKRRYAELKAQGASEKELHAWAEENRPDRVSPPGPKVYRDREKKRVGTETLKEARRERERREHWTESSVERAERKAERRSDAAERKKKWLEREKQKLQNQNPKSHVSNEGRSTRSEPSAGAGAESTESGEREAERADHRERDPGHQAGDRGRTEGSDIGNRGSPQISPDGGKQGLGHQEGSESDPGRSGGGKGESGAEETDHGRDDPAGDRAGSGELVDHSADGPSGGDRGPGSEQSVDRPDGMDAGASPGLERGHSDSNSSNSSGAEGHQPGLGQENDGHSGLSDELQKQMRQRVLERLRQLHRIREERRSDSERQRDEREAREELIREIDYRGIDGPPPELREMADHLDEKKAEALRRNCGYVALARSQGRDPVREFRAGWRPSASESEDKSKDKNKGSSKSKSKGEDKSQDRDSGRSSGRGWGGRGR